MRKVPRKQIVKGIDSTRTLNRLFSGRHFKCSSASASARINVAGPIP